VRTGRNSDFSGVVEFRDGGFLVKRIALLAAFVALTIVPQASAGPWIKSLADAEKKAKTGNQLIFVDLFADWCGWCHKMEQEVFPAQAFQNATDKMVLLRLNTEDGGEGTNLARQFNASSLPTFLILNSAGQLAGIIHGYQPANVFVDLLKEQEKKYDDFQNQLKSEGTLADPKKRLALAKELRERFALPESEQRLSKLANERGLPPEIRDEAFYELALTQLMEKHLDDTMKTLQKFASFQKAGEPFERSRLLMTDVYIAQNNWGAAADNLRTFKKTYPQSKFNSNVDYVLPQIEQQMKMAGGGKK
jgi:thioredoxin-related protein